MRKKMMLIMKDKETFNLEDYKNKPEVAYWELYLDGVLSVHKLLFHDFIYNEPYKGYDFFSLTDLYMRESEVRAKMDIGNTSALNKCDKQLLNSIPLEKCPRNDDEQADGILTNWMATIYVLLQWQYKLSSKEISEKLPAKELARIYNPLHETSDTNACRKIYENIFQKDSANI